jgi:hypothetical protein
MPQLPALSPFSRYIMRMMIIIKSRVIVLEIDGIGVIKKRLWCGEYPFCFFI